LVTPSDVSQSSYCYFSNLDALSNKESFDVFVLLKKILSKTSDDFKPSDGVPHYIFDFAIQNEIKFTLI